MSVPRVSRNGRRTSGQEGPNTQNLMQLNTKTNGHKPSPALANGQLWRTEKGHIRIVELGKMLVHYKMLRELRQVRRTQISRIDNMVAYLKTNEARLVRNSAAAV